MFDLLNNSVFPLMLTLWVILIVVWLIAALRTKRTVRRQSVGAQVLYRGPLLIGVVLLSTPGLNIGFLAWRFAPDSRADHGIGLLATAAGIAFAIWARFFIGDNWSATVTVKEGHTLIRKGPYRIVRHPIYTGILLAMLGTAITFGEVRCLLGVAIAFMSFEYKSRLEETFMKETFGADYETYRHEVKRLIPFVW